ncbi:response regulator [Caballeronia calidae]|uniref:Response regulator n=1 Tax=Caballeronia calidae TaxID=1777139 RepID=A0A158BZL2_9BURK|nr:response regulator [Caballeronia calidae]SAK75548.1 response regulator [Caballeronia calidae]
MATGNASRVLIADDDPNLLDAYALFLDAHGYDTRTARDGVEALATYSAWRPDVVVLDIQMPGMDGRAVAREIRRLQATPSPLLVAVTGLVSVSERAESLRSGFDCHLAKPVMLPALLATVAMGLQPGIDSH